MGYHSFFQKRGWKVSKHATELKLFFTSRCIVLEEITAHIIINISKLVKHATSGNDSE